MIKRILTLLLPIVFIANSYLSQSPPESFKYQAIVRDASGNILPNRDVSFQFTLRQFTATGSPIYQETFTVVTNGYGLVNLNIPFPDFPTAVLYPPTMYAVFIS